MNPANGCCTATIPSALPLGENPLQLDSAAPRIKLADYFKLEQRFKMLEKSEPRAAKELLAQAQADVNDRRAFYEFLTQENRNTDTKPMNLTTRYLGLTFRTPLVPSHRRFRKRSTTSNEWKMPARRRWCCIRCSKSRFIATPRPAIFT